MIEQIPIVGGPDKPGLQWSVLYPEKEPIVFEIEGDVVKGRLASMSELGDGTSFSLHGKLSSPPYEGRTFRATYDIGTRSGLLEIGH